MLFLVRTENLRKKLNHVQIVRALKLVENKMFNAVLPKGTVSKLSVSIGILLSE